MSTGPEKVIVLGATGFLGAYSCLALKSAGFSVVAVGHRKSDGGFFADCGIRYIGGFSIESQDKFRMLPTDIVAVINLAGAMPARSSFQNTVYVDSIITGTINLCEWMRRYTACRRVVFNTTPSDVWREFGVGVRVGDDAIKRYPATGGDHDIYAIAKIAAIDVLDHYKLVAGLSPIVFRHMNVYGFHPSAKYVVDGEERMSPWRILMRRAIAGADIAIYGDGNRKLELLSVYDFARAVVCAVKADATVNGMFNLAGDRPYSLKEEIQTIVAVFGTGNNITAEPQRPSRMETVLDRCKAARKLGWTPKLDWEQACRIIRKEFFLNRFRKLWGDVASEDICRLTLAVIGAGYLQLPLVRKAKEMGLRVVCFAWPEGAVCADECDAFYPISIVDRDKILEICKQEKVDGVTSIASDVAVPTMAHIAEKMGLAGNSQESAVKSTNKYIMRQALQEANVSCPRFSAVGEGDDIAACVKNLSYPLIVKPADRSGSMGVVRVDNPESLEAAIGTAIDASFCRMAVVEECITDFREVSVEGISWDGEYRILQITDKVTTGAPHYVELAHHQPALLPDGLRSQIAEIAAKGIAALGIRCGASHAELMITPDSRIYVTEIGARMGGDFIGSDLVRLSTGYDFLKGVIQCALGVKPDLPCDQHSVCSGVWFYAPETMWVKEMIDNHARYPDIVQFEIQRDDTIALGRSADRSGYFIYAGNSRIEQKA